MLSKLGLHRLDFTPIQPVAFLCCCCFTWFVCVLCVCDPHPPVLKIAAQIPWFEMLIKVGLASCYSLYLFLHAKGYAN